MHFAEKNAKLFGVSTRDSIGSDAWLSESSSVPICLNCQSEMQLFLQFDINEEFKTKLKESSHFVLFMCPICNEIPSFDFFTNRKLCSSFWEKNLHFYTVLFRPITKLKAIPSNSNLEEASLIFIKSQRSLTQPVISVGSTPVWIQDEESFQCCCGEEMSFFCQISENYPFKKTKLAAEQPDSFSADDYCLFLGNEIYIFACSNSCDERAVWISVQH